MTALPRLTVAAGLLTAGLLAGHGGPTQSEFNALAARVTTAESEIAALKAWRTTVDAKNSTQDATLLEHDSRLDALEGGGGQPACSDTVDNDGDSLIDYPSDPGCAAASDTDEFNVPPPAPGTAYYVDINRATGGNGSAANPWKNKWEINWSLLAADLQNGNVTLYFSSRSTWTLAEWVTITESLTINGASTRRLILDGQSKYNTVASGTAVWQDETDPNNRAHHFTTIGQSGGPFVVRNNNAFITIRGHKWTNAANGPIGLGEANPTLNIHDIIVENNEIESPQNGHGVWLGYAEAGCYNVIIRNNLIKRTPLEGIYVGHYNYLQPTLTGVVVEGNTLIDAGTGGEGDIDIKPPALGAIVRYNKTYATTLGNVLSGINVGASDTHLYGNELYNLRANWHPVDGASGIQINADGADGVGQPLANLLVYNNLIYGNQQAGIKVFAYRASITNLKLLNNTIIGNGTGGVLAGAGSGQTITISALFNNIVSGNAGYQIDTSAAVLIAAANHNLLNGALRYQGVDRTFAQWQALGFDVNGLNVAPQLDAAYKPLAGSPVIAAAMVRPEFTTDKAGVVRGPSWDIGAYER